MTQNTQINRFIEQNLALSFLGEGGSNPFGRDLASLLASDPQLRERLRQALKDDPEAVDRFEQALKGTKSEVHQEASRPVKETPQPAGETLHNPPAHREVPHELPSPLTLFGAPQATPVASVGNTAEAQEELSSRLREVVAQLLVSEGRYGGRQVRMDLQEDTLPGVTVVIEEKEGRLQVDFLCRQEPSRLRLVAAAPDQAPQMAQFLRRDVLMRVQRDDEQDPRLFEVAATA